MGPMLALILDIFGYIIEWALVFLFWLFIVLVIYKVVTFFKIKFYRKDNHGQSGEEGSTED